MKVIEEIEIYDHDGTRLNTILKTRKERTKLYFSFLGIMNNSDVDITSKIFNVLMNKTMFERVNLETLKNDPNIYKFFEMVEMYYHQCVTAHPRLTKSLRLVVEMYDFYTTYNLTELKDIRDYETKNLVCYIDDSMSPDGKKVVVSFPIVEEILPFLLEDMRATQTVERNIIMNNFAKKLINELYKAKKTKRDNKYVAEINDEIAKDDEYFAGVLDDYEESKESTLSELSYEIVIPPTVYNDLDTFNEEFYRNIIGKQDKDLMMSLSQIFDEEFKKENRDNKELIKRIEELLNNFSYEVEAICLDNLTKKYKIEEIIDKFHKIFYNIYYSENFDILFNPENDFGDEGRD